MLTTFTTGFRDYDAHWPEAKRFQAEISTKRGKTMKNRLLKTVFGTTLAILMLAVSAQIWVSAQDKSNEDNEDHQGIVGSWNVQVKIRDCQTGAVLGTFPAMITYNEGGTLLEAANNPDSFYRTPGQGVWKHQNGRTYSSAFHFFRFNADGTPAGTALIRRRSELNRSGNSFTSTSTFEFFDPAGNSFVSGCATETATRFE
jgi:hypothetical protein